MHVVSVSLRDEPLVCRSGPSLSEPQTEKSYPLDTITRRVSKASQTQHIQNQTPDPDTHLLIWVFCLTLSILANLKSLESSSHLLLYFPSVFSLSLNPIAFTF